MKMYRMNGEEFGSTEETDYSKRLTYYRELLSKLQLESIAINLNGSLSQKADHQTALDETAIEISALERYEQATSKGLPLVLPPGVSDPIEYLKGQLEREKSNPKPEPSEAQKLGHGIGEAFSKAWSK